MKPSHVVVHINNKKIQNNYRRDTGKIHGIRLSTRNTRFIFTRCLEAFRFPRSLRGPNVRDTSTVRNKYRCS